MDNSPGKDMARRIFYREILEKWLAIEQIRGGNYLTLLGPDARELEHLDALGVPRHRVWSVERRLEYYHTQQDRHLGVALYRGEMNDFLWHFLHQDQRFLVLNLDIEGS